MPSDAPSFIKQHANGVFAPVLRKGYEKNVEQARTMADVIEMDDRFIRGHVPEIEDKRYLHPMDFRKGHMRPMALTKKDPDFGALFRLIPAFGSVVIFRNRAIGLFRE